MQFMSPENAKAIQDSGVTLQLHTHRHRLPLSDAGVRSEIQDNRAALGGICATPLDHFCYPSGQYSKVQFPWLKALGIRSAVTTERGLVAKDCDRLALPRLLDSEAMTETEFEAEMSGFLHVLRRLIRS
jgi:peptidoglycan/xylan/chitin deacetylase (PgdA/CDA1 family)